MSRVLSVVLLGSLALPSLPSLPWKPHLPVWAERVLYNPRERTERAIEAYGEGEPEGALDLAETALRLAPDDARVQYNAGTAQLANGKERKAIALLEKAARDLPADLSPTAQYNLGNARLAAGDAAGAVQAYQQVLRAQPGNLDAKHNLELALRKEQEQKRGLQGRKEGDRGNRKPNQDPSNQRGKGNPDEDPRQGQDQRQPQQGGQPRPGAGGARDERLPQFRDQPEMSGREAASVLSAVENLERQQRRDQAAKRARQRAAKGKDW